MIQSFQTPSTQRRQIETADRQRIATPQAFELAYIAVDQWQIAALDYFRMGLNVFPIVRGEKDVPFGKWKRLQTTRLSDPDASEYNKTNFLLLFEGANVAVLTGRTSGNLTVLDCETREAADMHRAEFKRRNLHPWIQETARGLHFWFLLAEGEAANNPDNKQNPRNWEIRGHSNYVLAAPSVHPTGAVYSWQQRTGTTPPVFSLDQLDWLPLELHIKPRAKFTPREFDPLAKLSKPNRDFCLQGAPINQRNTRLFAAACDFAGNGIDIEDARPFLLQGCERSGYDKSFTQRQADRTIASAYKKQRTPAKQHKAQEYKVPAWVQAAVFTQHHKWQSLKTDVYARNKNTGKRRWQTISISAWTARKVFEACIIRAKRDNSATFRAAQREIAELANTSRKTVHRALHCLQGNGYLKRITTNEVGANVFVFGNDVLGQKGTNTYTWYNSIGNLLSKTSDELQADLFSRGALGETSGRVWSAARERPFTSAQIAKRIGTSERTARRALKELEKYFLVRKVCKTKWLSEDADADRLQRIAQQIETDKGRTVLGKTKRRRDKHSAERAEFATNAMLNVKNKKRGQA